MRKKVCVEVPEQPNVEKFVLLDRPETIYINLSCRGIGLIYLVPAETTDDRETPA